MCARYCLRTQNAIIADLFDLMWEPAVEARYNIAPMTNILTVVAGEHGRVPRMMRWGFVPSWAKDPAMGANLLNARSETAADRPAFREGLKHRRCLIPADGFFEWRTEGKKKQPYFFSLADGAPFAFAGIWETWHGTLNSVSILTASANSILEDMHDRSPVIVSKEDYPIWLGEQSPKSGGDFKEDLVSFDPPPQPELAPTVRVRLLQPFEAKKMQRWPVDPRVGNVRYDDASLIEPYEPREHQPSLF